MKSDDRVYQPLKNWKQLVSVLSDYQMRSNMSGNAANKHLVFFKEAVEHVCRACRVLRQPSAHMLLVGLDGTGKSTVLELATFISNCELFKLNIKKAYSYPDFRDDLKAVFKLTALQKKRIVFFIADKDITDVGILF
jgi:dynein heavy chain